MRRNAASRSVDLAVLLFSWELALRAERKSPATVKAYGDGVRRFLAWCDEHDRERVLERRTVAAFVSDLLEAGAEPATARSRHLALCRFSAWLTEEGELDEDPLTGSKPPKLDTKVTPILTEAQLAALLRACGGRELRDRRDEAIVRLMLETGMRAGEVVALTSSDVDLGQGLVTVRRGKGGRGRVVPVGPQTVRAIDRYVRARRTHRLADDSLLWVGLPAAMAWLDAHGLAWAPVRPHRRIVGPRPRSPQTHRGARSASRCRRMRPAASAPCSVCKASPL